MKKISQFSAAGLLFVLLFFLQIPPVSPYWVWSPELGKFVNSEETVQDTAENQYDYAMEFYKKKDLKETAKQLRLLLRAYPSSQVASEGQFRLGTVFEEMGDYYRAFRAYRDLTQRYPQSERMSEALKRMFHIGNLFLSGQKAKLLGLEILPSGPRAIEVFKDLVTVAPYSEWGDRAQFHLGLAYKKTNRFDEAIEAFQKLIDQYPQSKLVPQARFQVADVSYLDSVAATRDQRVIDRASEEIDRFLKHYPDSNVSDKAAKLRQEIDEKNAEKNYRIGLFYENENFLDSAFVYYRDVAARYPHTQWGQRAMERLQALEKPAEYLKAQEAEVVRKKEKVVREIEALGERDEAQKKDLEGQLKRLDKEEKEVGRTKEGTLKRRRAALRQKEIEIKAGWKVLRAKQKRFAKNLSEDLKQAFERWEASLKKEEANLAREKMLIEKWEDTLGVSTEPFYSTWVPFGKELSPLEQVERLEAKRLGELAEKSQGLLEEKEELYRQYEELLTLEGSVQTGPGNLETERKKLEELSREAAGVEKSLKEKEALYQQAFGTSPLKAVWQAPKTFLEHSVDVLNPFEGDSMKGWESKSLDELKGLESHWKEKIQAQKILVDTISRAFDVELAQAEQRRLLSKVEEKESDPSTLRRAIKQHEREIRGRYSEIQDRNARKNELLEKLEAVMKGEKEQRGGGGFTAPVRGFYKLSKAFLFGLPERDVVLTQEARERQGTDGQASEIQALREEIELESVLIEARHEEIQGLQRELDALEARASLVQAPRFRSLLVKFPYVFIREAIQSAGRIVPKENRKDKLIEQLNRESAELERLKKELAALEGLQAKKGERPKRERKKREPRPVETKAAEREGALNQAVLQEEIRSLEKQLRVKRESFEAERERFEARRWEKLSESRGKARTEKIKELEEKLAALIENEKQIHAEETALLAKKKGMVEQFLSELPADLFAKELNLQKEEIEGRLNQLEKREMTLGEEMKRFRPQVFPPS